MTTQELVYVLNDLIEENEEVKDMEVLIDQEDYGMGPIGFVDVNKWSDSEFKVLISGMC